MKTPKPTIFDGHNDVLSKIFSEGGLDRAASFLEGREGAIDLKKQRWADLEVDFLQYMYHQNSI